MFNKIYSYILKNKLIPENSKVVLGLSGGPDSVFLLYYFKYFLQNKIQFDFIAAHLDHEWREDSFKDIQFCKEICAQLNISFFYSKASELNLNLKHTGSKEELGRNMRRIFFEKIAQEQNATSIALAHHLQDQEETFFIRLIRGTTLSGLISMKARNGIYIRPLLEINKSEIISYLDKNEIKYLIDPSNDSFEFLRNRIRHSVIPSLKSCDQRFDGNFLRTLNNLKESEEFLENITKETFKYISEYKNEIYQIDLQKFFILDEFLQKRIIFYWLYKTNIRFNLTENFLNEIIRFLANKKSLNHKIHNEFYIEKKQLYARIIKVN